jgi:hypothetical protein
LRLDFSAEGAYRTTITGPRELTPCYSLANSFHPDRLGRGLHISIYIFRLKGVYQQRTIDRDSPRLAWTPVVQGTVRRLKNALGLAERRILYFQAVEIMGAAQDDKKAGFSAPDRKNRVI